MSDAIYRVFRVVRRRLEGEVGVTLILDGPLPAEPGQFVMVWLPGIEERPLAVMDDAPFALTIREVGPFSRALASLGTGDRVWVRGPFGCGFPCTARRVLLVGGGSGIASLTLLAKRILASGGEAKVALGARTAAQLMLTWQFEELGAPLTVATDDGTLGLRGTVLEAIEPMLADRWPDMVCACGPEPMLVALGRRLQGSGIPLYVSLERTMKCGFGVCGNCTCGDRLVCRDGPVFRSDDVLPVLDPEPASG
jgi:dihydroorotate dehydrogenase electron transfer subunit